MSRNSLTRGGMWGAGAMAVLMLALTGCGSTDDSDDGVFASKSGASPSTTAPAEPAQTPTSAASEDWTEPERWAVLPGGERTDRYGNETGFPHTTKGAVAMLKATSTTEVDRERSLVDQRLSIYSSYMAKADRSDDNVEKIELSAMQADKELHRDMGVDPSRPMPYGAYVRSCAVGFQLIEESTSVPPVRDCCTLRTLVSGRV
ncbi:hypothetical protein [Streptomyces scabiei]|uniref:hypothetical protein n=1 Tax=Streptomyces scabiei TaxID=1930 RepID=UPI00117EF43B|nr:hypothetical protein [Streptomyces scabiei]